jgi:hypothetical protein
MKQVIYEIDGSGQLRLTFVRENGERVKTKVYSRVDTHKTCTDTLDWLEKKGVKEYA